VNRITGRITPSAKSTVAMMITKLSVKFRNGEGRPTGSAGGGAGDTES